MKTLFSLAAFLLVATPAFAEPQPPTTDVSILKARVAPYRAAMDAAIEAARSLKAEFREVKTEISYEQCKEIERKIEAQYPISPFRALLKDGSSFASFCDWNPQHPSQDESRLAKMRYFFTPTRVKNHFGLQAAYILRIFTPNINGPFINGSDGDGEYLLDDQYRFIEVNGRSTVIGQSSPSYDVISLDAQGNYYYHDLPTKDSRWERAFFYSADGLTKTTWVKRPRRSDHGSEMVIDRSYHVNQKDWLQFLVVPNHVLDGYYQYAPGEWQFSNNNYDALYEIFLTDSGKEVCADGSTNTGKTWVSYKPSNNQDPWACMNVW